MGTDPSRRRFLALRPAIPPRAEITFGPDCFAARGIVCQSCADHCAEAAIRFRPRHGAPPEPFLEAALCTGCGDCLTACPAAAITLQADHV